MKFGLKSFLAQAHVSIAGTSARFGSAPSVKVVDFGTLEEGVTRTVYVQVRANQRVNIEIESENGGQLRHVERPESRAIPFSTTLDGQAFDLSNGPANLTRESGTGLSGSNHALNMTIGSVQRTFSGRYRDRIHVYVEPH